MVENAISYGLFVFNVIRNVNDNCDVVIDYVFPINNELKINIGKLHVNDAYRRTRPQNIRATLSNLIVLLQIRTKTVSISQRR